MTGDVSIGELSRKVDVLMDKVDALTADVTAMKIANARMSGRVNGGLGVLVFLGTVAGAVIGWFSHVHLS